MLRRTVASKGCKVKSHPSGHCPRALRLLAMTDMSAPKRRSRDELRQLLLDAGVDMVHQGIAGLGGSQITYAKLFDHLESTTGIRVTRGSVHERIWADQDALRSDVMRTAAKARRTDHNAYTDRIAHVVDRGIPSAREPRTEVSWEIIQIIGQASAQLSPLGWSDVAAHVAHMPTTAEPEEGLTAALREGYEILEDDTAELVGGLSALVRIRPNSTLAPDDVPDQEAHLHRAAGKLITSLSEGQTLRVVAQPEDRTLLPDRERPYEVDVLGEAIFAIVELLGAWEE